MKKVIIDACSAVGDVAYKLSQVIPIYPITPSSPMAEYCSSLNSKNVKNIFGEEVKIIEMQSEGGVAGTMHGALASHALSSTFTSSQGLLLMIPNMYKMVGENLPGVIHVASRAVASHALSIFCDHSDVMSARATGFIMLCSNSVQEAHYMATISHLLSLDCSLPVLHFFDGFRTSHEIQKINMFEDKDILDLLGDKAGSFLSSYQDKQFGTAQNPDVFFQNRIKSTENYTKIENKLQNLFTQIEEKTKFSFKPYEYVGDKDAEDVIVAMGSSCETIEEYIQANKEDKIGLVKIRLFRPFINNLFLSSLPKSVKKITILDRTKENGANPPLYLDVASSCINKNVELISGIYGLGGKEFTSACVKAVYDNMKQKISKYNFTIGINDDVFNSSLDIEDYHIKNNDFAIKIFGLGSDGSVSASKSTIKILGENYDKYVQGYFEYDSKKSGSLTISHLRLSNNPIKSEYLLEQSDVISINNFSFINRYDCLKGLKDNGVVVINSIFNKEEINNVLPCEYVSKLKAKNAQLYLINGQKIARDNNLGSKINIIMQAALFKCANLLSDSEIEENIGKYIEKSFAIKGKDVVIKNLSAMKDALGKIEKVDLNKINGVKLQSQQRAYEDKFYNEIMLKIKNLEGNSIPVSSFEKDGSTPLDTTKYEKRSIASRLPKWIKENCIQCGHCVLTCPHSALSALLIDCDDNANHDNFAKAIGLKDKLYKISLSPDDCTGCGACANACPALEKALEMKGAEELYKEKSEEYNNELLLKIQKQTLFPEHMAKGLQFKDSLFRFSGACAGCGETPYIKILTILNGSNMMIANATGCSSIYGGTFGSCPYGKDENGGIFWANSLFEDNAEFGLGIKLGNNFNNNKDKKVWIIGGDGWANDIGYGGLDHVLASGENINILVLDNQSYSNTGGQASKSTPTGASVKFADSGKNTYKKNLGLLALNYKDVFVGQVALGANINHTIQTLKEAQEYNGVSIVIAYSTCTNQGFELSCMTEEMRDAVNCGFWPIYKYNPVTEELALSSEIDADSYFEFLSKERRFKITMENNKNYLLEKQKNQAINEYKILENKSNKN